MGNKHVLITGGAGFVGSHLCDALINLGYDVTIYDNLLPQVHGNDILDRDGWPTYLNKKAHKINADLLSPEAFKKALEGITHLVHFQSFVGVGQSMTNIVDYTKNNVLSTALMLEVLAKEKHAIERMLLASSMSIYGEGEYFSKKRNRLIFPQARELSQLREKKWEIYDGEEVLTPVPTTEEKPLQPTSVYAINKRDQEEMFLVLGKALGIPTIALRFFNIYGSRQALSNPYTGVAAIFISRLMNDLPPIIFEDGKQKRDFVHVSDIVSASVSALESNKQIWDVFNVGSGEPIEVYEMAILLAKCLKKDILPQILGQYRTGDIRNCFADIQKIKKTFGYSPKKNLQEGMLELIEWVKQCPKPQIKTEESMSELRQNKLII